MMQNKSTMANGAQLIINLFHILHRQSIVHNHQLFFMAVSFHNHNVSYFVRSSTTSFFVSPEASAEHLRKRKSQLLKDLHEVDGVLSNLENTQRSEIDAIPAASNISGNVPAKIFLTTTCTQFISVLMVSKANFTFRPVIST